MNLNLVWIFSWCKQNMEAILWRREEVLALQDTVYSNDYLLPYRKIGDDNSEVRIMNLYRGGSRIPRRRWRQPSREAPTYDFAKFSEKLHEIEKILGRRGRDVGAPPLDPPLS